MIERLKKLASNARDEFISKRTTIEQDVDKHRTQLARLPEDMKQRLPFKIEDLTAKNHFPSLYADNYVEEQYNAEREKFKTEVLAHVITLRDEIVVQAEAVLDNYAN